MKSIKVKRPAPGTVLGLLALIVAMAGNADAFSSRAPVRKGDIARGAVTAKALATGAVHARALAPGAVHAKALAKSVVGAAALGPGAVGAEALGPDAVTAAALAPGSVYGAALGPVAVHGVAIADPDESADLSTWTTSDTAVAMCAPGERLLTGGVVFTKPGNHRTGVVEAIPYGGSSIDGFAGQITSDSGGTAAAEVQAICLK